ncbi:MAG: transposase [Acidobacteriota bacterium]|nr:transposase [Acidobacteriota bacterium]
MVRRRQRERSLFEVLLPDDHKLWPDWLRRIDTVLEDETVPDAVTQALEARWPQSRRRGRPGTPADVVIRMLILKHLFDWSYDDREQGVRANLVYRAFTRIDAGEVPDAKTILKIAGALPVLRRAQQQLRQMRPPVERVVAQTRARVVGGDTHVPDKVLSVFEPHTTTIRKGKISKPNEFGNRNIRSSPLRDTRRPSGRRDAVDAGLGPAPGDLRSCPWSRGGRSRLQLGGQRKAATDRGVRRVILLRRGPKSAGRRAYERQRWFRRGQRWRVGCEGRISVIKRRHGLRRCRYHGPAGMSRWVGLGVIADNLMNIATFVNAKAAA